MTTYRRRPTESWEDLAAAAAGVLTGAAIFYLARLWLQREPLPGGDRRENRSAGGTGEAGSSGRRARGNDAGPR